MGCDVDLSISTDTHVEHCVEYPANKVLSVYADTVMEISIISSLAVLVNLVTQTAIRLTNNIPTIEGDANRQEVVLLAFDRIACPDGFVE